MKKNLTTFILLLSAFCSFSQHTPVNKNFLLGGVEPEHDTAFVKVDHKYQNKDEKRTFYLQKPVYKFFLDMYVAAQAGHVTLKIVSATRNFEYQNEKWNKKWKALGNLDPKAKILKITRSFAMPTTSRHHWGTDIDFNSVEPDYFKTDTGKKVYTWLKEHAATYHFFQPYTADKARPGYMEEKWHWSFTPLSKGYLSEYKRLIKYEDIKKTKVAGNQVAEELNLIEKWVFGVNPSCK